MPSIRYETGLSVGDRAEPVLLDQVARQRHRREEEEDEEDREEALHRLAGADAQGEERADAAERERDRQREQEQERDARRARPRTRRRRRSRRRCRRAPGRGRAPSPRRACRRAATAPPSGVSASRLRKPVSMSVARSVPELSSAKIAALDERDREREAQVGVGREAGDVRSSRRARRCSPRAGTAGR